MDKMTLTIVFLCISIINPLVVFAQSDNNIAETVKDESDPAEFIEENNDKAKGELDGGGEVIISRPTLERAYDSKYLNDLVLTPQERKRLLTIDLKERDGFFSFLIDESLMIAGILVVMLFGMTIHSFIRSRAVDKSVHEAEKKAFEIGPESIALKLKELDQSQTSLEERAKDIASLIEQSTEAIKMGHLFNLYNKQLEKYQKSTQFRASYSFAFAIFAMLCGLGFVIWGATHILTRTGFENIAAGSAISAIGGSISAYITKTFLDAHKTSLNQLNRYFRQPVINEHILTAQRLADYLENNESRQKAYESIIHRVTELIREDINLSSSVQLDVSHKEK